MDKAQRQINYWTHMLDECFVNESIFDNKTYENLQELEFYMDLYPAHHKEIVQKAASLFKLNHEDTAWFFVADNGECALFNDKYEFDDISKVTKIVVQMIKDNIKNIIIPDSVISINKHAFSCCDCLKSVVMPDSVMTIKQYAFTDCNSLESVVMPKSLEYIGCNSFENCTELASMTIPNGVQRIRDAAFRNCASLKSIIIPDSVKIIGYKAFYECISLKSVVIPKSVKTIEESAFANCYDLESITLPDSLKDIEFDAFSECEFLETVYVNGRHIDKVKGLYDWPEGIEFIKS